MDIFIEDFLSADDRVNLFEWSESVFPAEGRGFTWAKPTHHVVARENGSAIAHIGFAAFTIIHETELPVIGVGGVVVRPEHQGKNIPSILFETLHAATTLDVRNSISTLFCPQRLIPYYEKQGYQEHQQGFRFLQDGNYVETSQFQLMVRGCPVRWNRTVSIPSNPW